MDHSFNIQGAEQTKWFKISASRIQTEDDTFAVVTFTDITTQKDYEALLNYQLTLDMTTGVMNKYALLNTLKKLSIGNNRVSIAFLDFDDFKNINDLYGHITGDRVLEIFCTSALLSIRHQDIVGRFGGEEFILIFPGGTAGLLIKALERIAKNTADRCEQELGFRPTFSAGVIDLSGVQLNCMEVDNILALVDENLYKAKIKGKNMIVTEGFTIPFKT